LTDDALAESVINKVCPVQILTSEADIFTMPNDQATHEAYKAEILKQKANISVVAKTASNLQKFLKAGEKTYQPKTDDVEADKTFAFKRNAFIATVNTKLTDLILKLKEMNTLCQRALQAAFVAPQDTNTTDSGEPE